MPIPSSSSMSRLASRVLSREMAEPYLGTFKFEIRLAVIRLKRPNVDLRSLFDLLRRLLDARRSKDGLFCTWFGLGGNPAPWRKLSPPFVIEPRENLCIVTTFSALILIFLDMFKSSSSSFRSVSSANSKSLLPLFFSSSAANSYYVAASIIYYYCWRIDLRSW